MCAEIADQDKLISFLGRLSQKKSPDLPPEAFAGPPNWIAPRDGAVQFRPSEHRISLESRRHTWPENLAFRVASADALVQAWQEPGSGRNGSAALDQALRDCAISLRATQPIPAEAGTPLAGDVLRDVPREAPSGPPGSVQPGPPGSVQLGPPEGQHLAPAHDALWQPGAHPLLFRLGRSLEDNRLGESAMVYWQSMVATSTGRLGRRTPTRWRPRSGSPSPTKRRAASVTPSRCSPAP